MSVQKNKFELACIILVTVTVIFFATSLQTAGIFPEYLFKYSTVFADYGLKSIFDTALIGDPRPRIVSSFFAYANFLLRSYSLNLGFYHPNFGINLIIYPLCVYVFNRNVRLIFNCNSISFTSTIIFCLSPAMLDMLCNFYIPAKPLCLLFTLVGIFICIDVIKSNRSPVVLLLAVLIIFSSLLCDESGVLIFTFLPFILFLCPNENFKRKFYVLVSMIASLILYVFFAIEILPLINSSLSQQQVNFIEFGMLGIYKSVFKIESSSFHNLLSPNSSIRLFEVIISSFMVPFRGVVGSWSSINQVGFLSLNVSNKYIYISVLIISIYLLTLLSESRIRQIFLLIIGLIAFCILQSILLAPLAPYLVDVNYYGNLSSIFICLILGILIGSPKRERSNLIERILFIFVIVSCISNFYNTAMRNPHFGNIAPSWNKLFLIKDLININRLDAISNNYGFYNRLFFWGYEMDNMKKFHNNIKVDVYPHIVNESTLSKLPETGFQDDKLLNAYPRALKKFGNKTENIPASIFYKKLINKEIRGSDGSWRFIVNIDAKGSFSEKIWYKGFLRQWYDKGVVSPSNELICFNYEKWKRICYSHFYAIEKDKFIAYPLNEDFPIYFEIVN